MGLLDKHNQHLYKIKERYNVHDWKRSFLFWAIRDALVNAWALAVQHDDSIPTLVRYRSCLVTALLQLQQSDVDFYFNLYY